MKLISHAFLTLPFLLFADSVSAVPTGSSINPAVNVQPLSLFTQKRPSHGLWTRFRDSIIEAIWGLPEGFPHVRNLKDRVGSAPAKALSRYGSDVVLRFRVSNPEEAQALSDAVHILFLDVWASFDSLIDIRVAQEVIPSLLGLLPPTLKSAHTLLIEDLSDLIYASYPSHRPEILGNGPTLSDSRLPASDGADLFFRDYQPFSVLVPWMKLMASMFKSHVEMIKVGTTAEGRDIPALRVGVRPESTNEPRKTLVVMGGAHAREWIGTSTVAYIAEQLITGYNQDSTITKLLETFDWILVPTINPDGYVYTWEIDRLWRKNRQSTSLHFCPGIDLDRAWGFEWDGEGTQANPCSESFAGNEAFEAVETRSIAEWVLNETTTHNANIVGFVDLHSYSQQILYPYSYSCNSIPPTLENLEELAFGIAKAIRVVNRENYKVTSACEGIVVSGTGNGEKRILPSIESTGGSALDWFYHQLHATYSYQIKLRDQGTYGFLLPASHIVPTGKEVFNSILAVGHFLVADSFQDVDWDVNWQAADTLQDERPIEDVFGRFQASPLWSVAPSTVSGEQHQTSLLQDEIAPDVDDEYGWDM